MNYSRSAELFSRAKQSIPGGVNSPVRAFGAVGGVPPFIESADGAYIQDIDGNRYIDYVGSWGPMVLGHRAPAIIEAITSALERSTSYGAPTESEILLAELICELVPSVEQARMVNSGTEATMSAIRLARSCSGREQVIKFNGCYHGHSDSLLVAAGSGVATFGIPGSPGIPEDVAKLTSSCEFNDLDALNALVDAIGASRVAAIIIEPVPGNMGLVLPEPGYLEGVRALCDAHGIILIFDEVMSGFRVAMGGAQERFNVTPDLTTLGKVIGGGLPVGAFGGRRELMSQLAPAGPVYQAGTLSGNPLAVSAGLASLQTLVSESPFPALEEMSAYWRDEMLALSRESSVPLQAHACGSMIGLFFSANEVKNYRDAKACNTEQFKAYFHGMLERGIYLAPSAFEAGFISTCHTKQIIDDTLAAAREVLNNIK